MIELLKELIAIPSISCAEKAAVDFLELWMKDKGLDVHRHKNNLWVESEAESDKPTLMLNAHIDTVNPSPSYTRNPYEPVIEDGKLFGLGSNDDGGSLVSMIFTYMELVKRTQPYRLLLVIASEEEKSGYDGIEAVLDKIGNVTLGIIGEPTGMRMAVEEKGLMVLDCTAHGKSGHAAREEGVNAIYKAMEDINWFRTYKFGKVSDFTGSVKMSVTVINAGSLHNVVPSECKYVVDVRNNGMYTNRELLTFIRDHVTSDVEPRSLRHNGAHIDMDHPVVVRGLGLGLEAFGSPTTSDQSVCPFTTIKIGPGESSRSHTADEFIYVSEVEQSVPLFVKLLDGLQL